MDKKTIEKLIDTALAQLDFSYAPYSGFNVGAALLAKNQAVYTLSLIHIYCRNRHLNRHVRIAYHRILKPELFPLLICDHKEVQETADRVAKQFTELIDVYKRQGQDRLRSKS